MIMKKLKVVLKKRKKMIMILKKLRRIKILKKKARRVVRKIIKRNDNHTN
jgi:hypothetical protein